KRSPSNLSCQFESATDYVSSRCAAVMRKVCQITDDGLKLFGHCQYPQRGRPFQLLQENFKKRRYKRIRYFCGNRGPVGIASSWTAAWTVPSWTSPSWDRSATAACRCRGSAGRTGPRGGPAARGEVGYHYSCSRAGIALPRPGRRQLPSARLRLSA